MKANELRIGNFVKSTTMNYECVVYGILNDRLVAVTYPSGVTDSEYPEQLAPVQLTEDWLLRAGFIYGETMDIGYKLNGDDTLYELRLFNPNLYVDVDYWTVQFNEILDIDNPDDLRFAFLRTIQYVHQLQNLYFALTGNELTFADNHNPCTSDDPDDLCDHCNCWKSTRKNCS